MSVKQKLSTKVGALLARRFYAAFPVRQILMHNGVLDLNKYTYSFDVVRMRNCSGIYIYKLFSKYFSAMCIEQEKFLSVFFCICKKKV
jgi:hypothetical protein